MSTNFIFILFFLLLRYYWKKKVSAERARYVYGISHCQWYKYILLDAKGK